MVLKILYLIYNFISIFYILAKKWGGKAPLAPSPRPVRYQEIHLLITPKTLWTASLSSKCPDFRVANLKLINKV